MANRSETCAIAVMAKAPRPGHVKTRLQLVLRPEEAAALGTAFLRDTLENLDRAQLEAPIATFVAYAPAGQEARFDGLLPPGAALLVADGSNGCAPGVEGFGCVLLETVRALLSAGFGAACVLAADSPTLPTGELVRAASLLLQRECDAVLGPVRDGGYYALGLRRPEVAPFTRIRWSTDRACADTRARLAEAGLRSRDLQMWFDVDDPDSLDQLLHTPDGYPAPHTRAVMERLQLRARLHSAASARAELTGVAHG